MEGYVAELMKEFGIRRGKKTPATEGLFKVGSEPPLADAEKSEFHTATAKLLYLAMRVRPEILSAVAFLCTRVAAPTKADQRKLERVLEYLHETGTDGITISGDCIDQLRAMIDASFALHGDGRSHSGLALMLGSAVIMVKSSKQKLMSKDSTEAELIALSDMLRYVDKCNCFMLAQGIKMKTPILCQDNTSTISLVTKGGGMWRNKYMRVRQESVRERVTAGDFTVEYVPTGEMVADVLTKPLHGKLFEAMRHRVRGRGGVVRPDGTGGCSTGVRLGK